MMLRKSDKGVIGNYCVLSPHLAPTKTKLTIMGEVCARFQARCGEHRPIAAISPNHADPVLAAASLDAGVKLTE
jgi:hypothetical protein